MPFVLQLAAHEVKVSDWHDACNDHASRNLISHACSIRFRVLIVEFMLYFHAFNPYLTATKRRKDSLHGGGEDVMEQVKLLAYGKRGPNIEPWGTPYLTAIKIRRDS